MGTRAMPNQHPSNTQDPRPPFPKGNDALRSQIEQAADKLPSTIQAFLAKNAAYRQTTEKPADLATDDDVCVILAQNNNPIPTVESILSAHKHSGNLVLQCKEVIKGWPSSPSSFVFDDADAFARLAACYMIQFPSFMCYAVTALRILSYAPWTDHILQGHIRELVLCAIGKGWTWTDQSAELHQRRVSLSEVCTAIATCHNLHAFPPGQIADLDMAIIEVCDDLYPQHSDLFFPQLRIQCHSCAATGTISVSIFDTYLIWNTNSTALDFAAMIMQSSPRLALDREGLSFCHSSGCPDHDQLKGDKLTSGKMFVLKMTRPVEDLPA